MVFLRLYCAIFPWFSICLYLPLPILLSQNFLLANYKFHELHPPLALAFQMYSLYMCSFCLKFVWSCFTSISCNPTSVKSETITENLKPRLLIIRSFFQSPHVNNCKLSSHLYFKPHLLGILCFSLSCYHESLFCFLLLWYLLLLFSHTSWCSFPWLYFL